MLIVVADASPFRYLVEIECAEILPKLFNRILVPTIVVSELTNLNTPVVVREWIRQPPAWIEVANPRGGSRKELFNLDDGERAALLLALESQASAVLMDDRAGVQAAEVLGLVVIPTLRILQLAARRGLLSLPEAFDRIKRTNFRCSQELLDRLLSEL